MHTCVCVQEEKLRRDQAERDGAVADSSLGTVGGSTQQQQRQKEVKAKQAERDMREAQQQQHTKQEKKDKDEHDELQLQKRMRLGRMDMFCTSKVGR